MHVSEDLCYAFTPINAHSIILTWFWFATKNSSLLTQSMEIRVSTTPESGMKMTIGSPDVKKTRRT